MGRFRYGKPDDNQGEIVKVYRTCGWQVTITSQMGGGFPDLILSKLCDSVLAEVKVKKGRIRDSQKNFCRAWQGKPVALIRSKEEAIKHIQTGEYVKLVDVI